MSALAFRPHKASKRVTLSVTPLIDVLFLLIIFFSLTSTFEKVGELELQLPDSATATALADGEEERVVELVVTEAGRLILDGEDVELRTLKRRLREKRDEAPNDRILLKADAAVEHGEVVLILDLVRGAGFAGVGIGTQRTPMPPGLDE